MHAAILLDHKGDNCGASVMTWPVIGTGDSLDVAHTLVESGVDAPCRGAESMNTEAATDGRSLVATGGIGEVKEEFVAVEVSQAVAVDSAVDSAGIVVESNEAVEVRSLGVVEGVAGEASVVAEGNAVVEVSMVAEDRVVGEVSIMLLVEREVGKVSAGTEGESATGEVCTGVEDPLVAGQGRLGGEESTVGECVTVEGPL